ncbi:hypothetical protein SAMN02910358_02532 [Lachnospiraceae bacterium XBB1006]|nr:hypothetical protein SAMN02910358_02532 [Lachnospiraceae bacterium XBB1006]
MMTTSMKSTDGNLDSKEKELLDHICARYQERGFQDGYNQALSFARISDIAILIKNSGQDIYARKFLEASNLELRLAKKKISEERAEQQAREKALEAAENARLGKTPRDWQWK